MNNPSDNKLKVFIVVFIITGLIIICKLFYLQVIDTTYKISADKNVLRYIYDIPSRGLIYDRNGKLIVFNDATYDLVVVPRYTKNTDTLDFCSILEIDVETYKRIMNRALSYSKFLPTIFCANLSKEKYSQLQEQLYRFQGFYINTRSVRKYSYPVAAHSLGYLGEVTQEIIDNDKYYRMGDYVGISGVEKSYEKELGGKKGLRIVLADVHNREMGSFKDGLHDTMSIPGKNIYLSLDIDLQKYGELLFQNKRGAVVAIEPATGEILAAISSPSYDPNLLVGANRNKTYMELFRDVENNPLFNRAIMTRYPPGSVFKIVSGIAALEEGIIDENTVYGCGGGYSIGRHIVKCHHHHGTLSLLPAIALSCNTYFCRVFKNFVDNKKFNSPQEGFEKWKEYLNSLGFGVKLGTDFPNELTGFVPTADFFTKMHKGTRWRANTVISLAIGQGEIGTTPLQLANLTAIIANRGWYITPHIVKSIGHIDRLNQNYKEKKYTMVSQKTYETFVEGMHKVTTEGTARRAVIEGIEVCGKTGTSQDPPRKNHSVFIAFAPKHNPKIAIAVLVENSGYGATWAAPIASLMMEQYLTGEVKRKDMEEFIMNAKLLDR